MMVTVAIYDQSGSITRIVFCKSSAAEMQAQGDERFLLVSSNVTDDKFYIKSGKATEKQAFNFPESLQITASGQDEAVITGIPAGVSVTWPDGQTDEVTDGEVRFSVDLPGTYRLKFTAVEYLDKEVTIEAVAAT